MPTVISHPAVALALRPWLERLQARALVAGAILTALPDVDVIAFRLGIPYGSTFGHRGFTHSIIFAALASIIAALIVRGDRRTCVFLFACALSHGLLDAMTNGGRGIAFFSPFSNERYFLPWRPIQVSPIGAVDARVLVSELRWVWLPAMAIAAAASILRRRAQD